MFINSPLIPAVFALIGTILGAVFGGIIPHYLREKSANKSFLKNKLELLYSDINLWLNKGFCAFIVNFNLVFDKVIDWNKYLDIINDSNISKDVDFFKIEIIVHLYFKELKTDFSNLTLAFQDLNRYINNEIKKIYLSGNDISLLKDNYNAKVKNVTLLAEKLKDSIKNIAKKI